ncbi:MAG: Sb-PDE family phosphodiesterase, partial [Planctomycetota bacterium]
RLGRRFPRPRAIGRLEVLLENERFGLRAQGTWGQGGRDCKDEPTTRGIELHGISHGGVAPTSRSGRFRPVWPSQSYYGRVGLASLRQESLPDNHRTATLVFASGRTLEALKEALRERRTAVWFKDQLIGRQEWLEPLFHECVQVSPPHLRSKDAAWVEIRNVSDVDIRCERTGGAGPAELNLPARTTSVVKIAAGKPDEPLELRYTATNFLIAPGEGLPVVLPVAAGGSGK